MVGEKERRIKTEEILGRKEELVRKNQLKYCQC